MPRLAAERPHARPDLARVAQVHVQVGAARVVVDRQNVIPGRAAVPRAEDAALGVGSPLVTQRADIGDVGVLRMHADALDALRVVEADVGPGLAAVGRAPDAQSVRNGVTRVALAGAEIEDVVVRRGHVDGAHRIGLLVLPLSLEGVAAVGRLPQTAVSSAEPEDLVVAGDAEDRSDPATHVGGADAAPGHGGERLGEITVVLRP